MKYLERAKAKMSYITQLTGRKATFSSQILTMVLTGFVLVLLQSSTTQAQWTTPDGQGNISNTNTGKVGIGTSSPTTILDANGSIRLRQNPGGNVAASLIELGDRHTGWGMGINWNIYYDGSWHYRNADYGAVISLGDGTNQGDLLFTTIPSGAAGAAPTFNERMRITNSGNVGLGTTSPSLPLEVRGNAVVFTSGARAVIGNYDSTPMAQGVGGGIQFGGKFDTSGTTAGFASISGIKENATNNDFSSALVFTTRANPNTQTEKMRISSTGNVGIGTTTPSSKLHLVSGTDNSTSLLNLDTGVHGGTSMVVYGTGNNESGYDLSVYRAGQYFSRFGVNSFGSVYLQSGTGNVGIGTATPNSSYKLDVNGNTNVTGDLNATGAITGGTIQAKYQDVAEWVQSSQELAAGTVVVLDQTQSNQVIASTQAYDTRVAGVISAQPGITLGEKGESKVLVATTGRVRIKVDASRGSIQVGDLLVTSDLVGVAMKSQPINVGGVQIHRPGTLIGKALEPLDKGIGEILVLLSLQ